MGGKGSYLLSLEKISPPIKVAESLLGVPFGYFSVFITLQPQICGVLKQPVFPCCCCSPEPHLHSLLNLVVALKSSAMDLSLTNI